MSRFSEDQIAYRDDLSPSMELSMVNYANLALKAVRLFGRKEALRGTQAKGTGPDILDMVSPLLVG